MRFDVMTLFCDMVRAPLDESILGRAQKNGLLELHCHNIRDYTHDRHHRVDDTPYGGGKGMLMMPAPICECYDAIPKTEGRRRCIYLSPKGALFTQKKARELASYDQLILLCGHYEGVDQRAIDLIADEELSIGDYVLTGGELAACVVIDAVGRLLEGVLPDPICHEEESLSDGLLEYPQYTRPPVYRTLAVPEVLQSGDHEKIRAWRRQESIALTVKNRPDLIDKHQGD